MHLKHTLLRPSIEGFVQRFDTTQNIDELCKTPPKTCFGLTPSLFFKDAFRNRVLGGVLQSLSIFCVVSILWTNPSIQWRKSVCLRCLLKDFTVGLVWASLFLIFWSGVWNFGDFYEQPRSRWSSKCWTPHQKIENIAAAKNPTVKSFKKPLRHVLLRLPSEGFVQIIDTVRNIDKSCKTP